VAIENACHRLLARTLGGGAVDEREIADKAREGVRESENFDLQASLVERWASMSSGVEVRLGG